MTYSQFCQKLKEPSLDRELDMYRYGMSCGVLSFVNLDDLKEAFVEAVFTRPEIDLHIRIVVAGYCEQIYLDAVKAS